MEWEWYGMARLLACLRYDQLQISCVYIHVCIYIYIHTYTPLTSLMWILVCCSLVLQAAFQAKAKTLFSDAWLAETASRLPLKRARLGRSFLVLQVTVVPATAVRATSAWLSVPECWLQCGEEALLGCQNSSCSVCRPLKVVMEHVSDTKQQLSSPWGRGCTEVSFQCDGQRPVAHFNLHSANIRCTCKGLSWSLTSSVIRKDRRLECLPTKVYHLPRRSFLDLEH